MKKDKNQIFYRLTPILTILIALAVLASAIWEWRASPKANVEGDEALQNENYSEAIRKFSQAQQYCETDISARFNLGTAYQNYGWQDEALQEYATTWNFVSHYGSKSMHNAGRIWLKKGDKDKAILCFDRALALNPAMPEVWFELAQVYISVNKTKRAESCLSKALKYDPENRKYQHLLLTLALQRQQKVK